MGNFTAHGFEDKDGGYRDFWYVTHTKKDWPYGIRIFNKTFNNTRMKLLSKGVNFSPRGSRAIKYSCITGAHISEGFLYNDSIIVVNQFKKTLKEYSWKKDIYVQFGNKLIIVDEKYEDIGFDPIWKLPQKHIVIIAKDQQLFEDTAKRLKLPLENQLVDLNSRKTEKLLNKIKSR